MSVTPGRKSFIPVSLLGAYHDARSFFTELPHYTEFKRFYSRLEDKKDPYYMYFSSGLLHWALRALDFVPPEVNLVLLGSALTPEEESWIRSHVKRPFHHLRLRTDDKTAWELLFEVNKNNFGWLDVDCFVLNPELFREMAQISPDTAINCTWSFAGPQERDILLTYFLFINADVIRAVRSQVRVSPSTYSYEVSRQGRPAPYAFCRIPTARQIELLSRRLPSGADGRPQYVSQKDFFDTLQVYQSIADVLGYRLHKVRPLNATNRLYSEELVHVGKVSYFKQWKTLTSPREQMVYALLLQADYVLLTSMSGRLPEQYSRMREEIRGELIRLGISTDVDQARNTVCGALASRGASPAVIARVIGEGQAAPAASRSGAA
jgi:hypothetical protein